AMRSEPERDWVPRVKIFAGKAAAGYAVAKLIIKLANDVAAAINTDPLVKDLLKVVFLPNYNVSLAEVTIPAAELSEQISTAGMEAGAVSPGEPHRFVRLTQALRHADDYLVTADFEDYLNTQRRIDALFQRHADWAKACVMNIAGMGWFSSDRAIRGYAEAI